MILFFALDKHKINTDPLESICLLIGDELIAESLSFNPAFEVLWELTLDWCYIALNKSKVVGR